MDNQLLITDDHLKIRKKAITSRHNPNATEGAILTLDNDKLELLLLQRGSSDFDIVHQQRVENISSNSTVLDFISVSLPLDDEESNDAVCATKPFATKLSNDSAAREECGVFTGNGGSSRGVGYHYFDLKNASKTILAVINFDIYSEYLALIRIGEHGTYEFTRSGVQKVSNIEVHNEYFTINNSNFNQSNKKYKFFAMSEHKTDFIYSKS